MLFLSVPQTWKQLAHLTPAILEVFPIAPGISLKLEHVSLET